MAHHCRKVIMLPICGIPSQELTKRTATLDSLSQSGRSLWYECVAYLL